MTDTVTQQSNGITIVANYNQMKSSLVAFEESSQLNKFKTYSEIIIKRYCFDDINITVIENMITDLVALAELSFPDRADGSKKKFNVKSQVQTILNNTKTTICEKIADSYLDNLIDRVCKENTREQLIQLAHNILKITTKVTSGCLKGCF
ncbi:Conserved_hypothetical protein [Hexamita inflata]|uniref:Uncharacterized protein n=1 Tax=Hexamita inflata TaxID=28002 RepID=A0AA86UH96_9EUKA|nr:Conserved hypothetical protein [Hexamita inflata]CAI9964160.1 Conserved hypothetical protein [Hexamita inflata]